MKLTRRDTLAFAISASTLIRSSNVVQAAEDSPDKPLMKQPMHCNIVTVPDMVQLDITGPFEVLSRTPGWTVDLVAATMDPPMRLFSAPLLGQALGARLLLVG
jgi:cyclohexyl-isocyanide hydratase